MCTKVDDKVTEIKRKRLKNKNNIGWKIVEVEDNGRYKAPFYEYFYNLKVKNITNKSIQVHNNGVHGGVFHLLTARSAGRSLLKVLKSKDHWMSIKHMKLVKVFYDKKDFYGVGNAVNFSDIVMEALKTHKNNTTCVKGFSFPEK